MTLRDVPRLLIKYNIHDAVTSSVVGAVITGTWTVPAKVPNITYIHSSYTHVTTCTTAQNNQKVISQHFTCREPTALTLEDGEVMEQDFPHECVLSF